jgi:hypothetical protein
MVVVVVMATHVTAVAQPILNSGARPKSIGGIGTTTTTRPRMILGRLPPIITTTTTTTT